MSIFSNFKPISTALLPNAEVDDIKLVLQSFLPWNWNRWRTGKEIGELENKFQEYFGAKNAISFFSGRVGLYAILFVIARSQQTTKQSLAMNSQNEIATPRISGARNDSRGEIILQAYTTIALPLAIKQVGFMPVYIDIKEDTFNIDVDKIEKKITANTRAIIIQHTFGIPAEMDKIVAICKKHNLFLIEDCAHSLGAEFAGQKVGTFGDAAFFSFGRDKIISSTSGGMVIANNEKLAEKIREFQNSLEFPSLKWIFQQLAHPLVFWCALPIYYFFNIGKLKIFLAQKLGIISRAYSEREKKGIVFPLLGKVRGSKILQGKLSNILAILALSQFKKLERFNNHRSQIAEIYQNEFHCDNMNYYNGIKVPLISEKSKPIFLYYTIQVDRRDELLKFAAKKGIILGDWFPGALGPKGVDEEKFDYRKGDCPIAERVGAKSLNLPTNIKTSEADARKVVGVIKEFLDMKRTIGC